MRHSGLFLVTPDRKYFLSDRIFISADEKKIIADGNFVSPVCAPTFIVPQNARMANPVKRRENICLFNFQYSMFNFKECLSYRHVKAALLGFVLDVATAFLAFVAKDFRKDVFKGIVSNRLCDGVIAVVADVEGGAEEVA